jgi:hypothetical protein
MEIKALNVSGQTITLTMDQINSDPGNAFAKFFSANDSYEMGITSEPGLFRLIQEHLMGYEIFPLTDGSVPYMSKERAMKNLLKEAERFELQGLVSKIRRAQIEQVDPTLPSQWKIVVSTIFFLMSGSLI